MVPRQILLNFHAAVFLDCKAIGFGIVIRSGSRSFLAGTHKKLNFFPGSLTAEAIAAYHAVEFALECNGPEVIFEGDALAVLNLTRDLEFFF